MGRTFQEFERGETFTTAGRRIAETDVLNFVRLTGDVSQLHVNEEYAKTTRFGRRVVPGALVFSISVGLMTGTNLLEDTLVAFSRVEHLRFTMPVFIGDTIAVEKTVAALEGATPENGLLVFDTRVRNQHGQVVLAYIDTLLVAARFC